MQEVKGREQYPNILLIVIDALRTENLDVYGTNNDLSPSISKVAHQGIIFEDGYSTWNTTDQSQITKHGTWGLPLFIWLPFPWTGALIGAAVGFLIGMSTRRAMLVVMPSMLIGIVSWVLGFEYLFLLTGMPGKRISIFILAGILLAPILRSG